MILKDKGRIDVKPGDLVMVLEKRNQLSGKLTKGVVEQVLTSDPFHPYGIKVRLTNGTIGRVKKMLIIPSETHESSNTDEQILKRGEDQFVEFKSSFRFDVSRFENTGIKAGSKEVERSISKTVASFLNSSGGTLYIGVNDNGDVNGLDFDYSLLDKPTSDRFRLNLKHSLESYLKNKMIFEHIHIEIVKMYGKEICKIQVKPCRKAVFLHEGGRQECYVRVDNESALYNYDEFIEYLQTRGTRF